MSQKHLKFFKPLYSQLVNNSGATNITSTRVPDRSTKYLSDLCTTLIDIKWRWNLLIFFSGFVLTWLLFSAYYFLLCYLHGDLDHEDTDWMPCVQNIQSFASAFLFSIETMSTIGYGYRFVTEACPGAYFGVLLQSVIGAGLQFALAGLVVAKVRRSKKRSGTLLFSDVACIVEEDLQLRLVIRVGDMRKSHIIGAHARGYLIRRMASKTGEKIPVQYFSVEFRAEGGNEKLFLPWPTYIVHIINDQSPLWNLARDDLLSEHFELVVVLEGITSTTSKSFQARKSYHSWEIRWGHRFQPLEITTHYIFENIVDYENFHDTRPIMTPLCSAKDIAEMVSSGQISPENLQRRRDSRVESLSLFRHRKSVTDTYLGPEFDFDELSEESDA